ncbi:transmembrane protein 132A [Trichomycterus rosablanca]|uniref:transmembrane protein 132A n=1 Tax=Trichomycterus rosablanca TaxID=2290929 RepID=UPI002F352A34
MGVISLFVVRCSSITLDLSLLFWFVMLSHTQPPPYLSLPVQISVPPPWRSLPVSQADLGPLFTNSSPFSFTQCLLLMPPVGHDSRPVLRATLGPYSVTQLVSEAIAPLSAPLVAVLLSKTMVRERESKQEARAKVRVLFYIRGDTRSGRCVTLHAFKQTEEHKSSCITQPPLGLCVVSMMLPSDWFKPDGSVQLDQDQSFRHHQDRIRSRTHGPWWKNIPESLRAKPEISRDKIQLYSSSSSSFGIVTNPENSPSRCVGDRSEQSQRNLYYIGSLPLSDQAARDDRTEKEFSCSGELQEDEIWLNPNVLMYYNSGPVRAGQPVGVTLNLRANFSADFFIVRLRVKKRLLSVQAQPTMSADQWTVKVRTTSGSKHNTFSIICHRTGTILEQTGTSVLRQVACLSVQCLRRSFGVAMTVAVNWWVEYTMQDRLVSLHGPVTTLFSFTDRDVVGIAPITGSNTIINTAILTGQPVSLHVLVLGVGQDGKVTDITMAVKCQSASEDIVKVSSDCSAVFVDGTESVAGGTCAVVEFSLGRLSNSLCLTVWAPVVPLRISLSDPVLSPISGWSYYTSSRCSPVYQRSNIQVLAQFSAQPLGHRGEPTFMLGSADLFVDVTDLVRDWLRVENPRVAALYQQSYLMGLEPGVTSLNVISSQWDGVLGSARVIVTSEPVAPSDLSVQLVGGLGLSVIASPSHPSVITAAVTSHNTLYNHGQEAAISIWLQFSDDSAVPLSAFGSVPFSPRLSSLAESVVAVSSQRVLARGDGGGPLVKAELLVSTCDAGGTKRLAKGSGWIRVNLDSDLWSPSSEDSNFEITDTPDTLVDQYYTFGYERATLGFTNDYDFNTDNEINGRNDLERAASTSTYKETAVYFSPEMEKENAGEKTDHQEPGLGVGAVCALVCLSALLFLVNFVPCALRKRQQVRKQKIEDDGCTGEEKENKNRYYQQDRRR